MCPQTKISKYKGKENHSSVSRHPWSFPFLHSTSSDFHISNWKSLFRTDISVLKQKIEERNSNYEWYPCGWRSARKCGILVNACTAPTSGGGIGLQIYIFQKKVPVLIFFICVFWGILTCFDTLTCKLVSYVPHACSAPQSFVRKKNEKGSSEGSYWFNA